MFSALISLYLSYKKFQIIHHKKTNKKIHSIIHVRSDSSHVFLHQRKKKPVLTKRSCVWDILQQIACGFYKEIDQIKNESCTKV